MGSNKTALFTTFAVASVALIIVMFISGGVRLSFVPFALLGAVGICVVIFRNDDIPSAVRKFLAADNGDYEQ